MGNRDVFMARYSAFSPYRLREREMGFPTPIGAEDAMAKSLYCGMKPIACWDCDRGKTVPTGGVFNLEFSPDGAILVAACEKKSIQIFDPLTHQKIQSVNGAHSDCVNCVKFLDARMFATCSDDTTIALWDVRNLKKKIRTLLGHSKWVKNIEFSVKDKLLVTSGLDGSIYTWDINSYTEYNLVYQKVFHTSSLMRCRLSPDARQMVMCTTGGLLIIIHDLNLSTLAQDLHGFKPNLYRLMQMSQQLIPIAAMYDHLFDSSRKENRVEFVSDFPEDNDAEVVSALQIHPQGWSALSRNISHDDRSEWTCIHDIQPFESDRGVARDSCRVMRRPSPSPSPASPPAPVPPSALAHAPPPRRLTPRRMPTRARLRPTARSHSRPQLLDGIPTASVAQADAVPEPEPGPSSAASVSSVPVPDPRAPPPPGAAPAPAPAAPPAPPAARLVASMSSIQNDVWEASITVKQNRMLQEFYSRGQVRRNFNMQRITGINTGISPPAALRPRLTGFGFAVDPGESMAPSTSGHTSRDIATVEGAPRRFTDRFIRQNKERLLYYIEETNEGKGFIKELCYSADGRLVCSPFGRGMRLLALNEDCSELSQCVQDFKKPRVMVDVGQSLGIHQDLVVSSRFSPRYHMLVTGCLEGKIVWYQPYSGEALY